MPNEEVRITFLQISMNESVRRLGSGRFRFIGAVAAGFRARGTIATKRFGEIPSETARQDVRDGVDEINLEDLGWSMVLRLPGLQSLEIKVVGNDDQRGGSILGSTTRRFTQVLNIPGGGLLYVPQGIREDHNEHFTVRYRIEPKVEGNFGIFPRNTVFAARANNGSVSYTTVAGNVQLARIEVCPVRPVPPANTLPPRPVFPPGAPAGQEQGGGVGNIIHTSPINSVQNPSVIPILAPGAATGNNTAHLKVTYYRPQSLNLTDDDHRLEWSAEPANRVRFLNNRRNGQSVKVYGTGAANAPDIDVTFTLKFCGEECAKFRAVLGPIKTIPCRFNIFQGPPGPAGDPNRNRPRSISTQVFQQMQVANIFLRQVGIQLSLDTNATLNTINPGGGPAIIVTASPTPGIFNIAVPAGQTRNAPWDSIWLKANYRANVMNFCYLKSSTLNALGFAFKWPEHPRSTSANNRWSFQENGTPSTSWKQPSGVLPDVAAQAVTMKVIAGYKCNNALPNDLYGMAITDLTNPGTAAGRIEIAGTIVHELGHMLSLGHRVEDPAIANGMYDDEAGYPPRQNLMHYNASTATAQNFDIAQAKIMRSSALIR